MSRTIEQWVSYISEQEMPAFKHAVVKIAKLCEDEDSSSAQLSHVILQDTNLTARVLKLANSTFYNRSRAQISTISRALLLIGFNAVRDLCLTVTLIDTILKTRTRDHVLALMAQAFHAAVQARAFAQSRHEDNPEEVFIATLLYRLGEMAFYCTAGDEADQVLQLVDEAHYTTEQAETTTLGFRLKALSVALTREWQLGPLLKASFAADSRVDRRANTVLLGHKVAKCAQHGWSSNDSESLQSELAEFLGMQVEETSGFLRRNAQQAVEVARSFGAAAAAALIPGDVIEASSNYVEEDAQDKETFPEPDVTLQLNVLREMSSMLQEQPDLNTVLQVCLEGIYRGIGMDRVVFALVDPQRKQLRAKYALGYDNESLATRFNFPMSAPDQNIFSHVICHSRFLWLHDDSDPQLIRLTSFEIRQRLEVASFFLYPISVQQRPVGLLYADRQPSSRELNLQLFESFCHFGQQADMALDFISKKTA